MEGNEGDVRGRLSIGEGGLVLSLFALFEFLQLEYSPVLLIYVKIDKNGLRK